MNREKAANITNLVLGSTIPVDEAVTAFFNNDPEPIKKAIATKSKDASEVLKAIQKGNYEIENDQLLSKESNYGEVQKAIVEQLITPENAEFMATNIINSEEVLGEHAPELTSAGEFINGVRQQNIGMEIIK